MSWNENSQSNGHAYTNQVQYSMTLVLNGARPTRPLEPIEKYNLKKNYILCPHGAILHQHVFIFKKNK